MGRMQDQAGIIDGLKMIRDRYYFGMFVGSNMDMKQELDEYKMRDALYGVIEYLENSEDDLFTVAAGGNHND